MKTKHWILLIGMVFALCLGFGIFLMQPGEASSQAQITSQGTVIKTVDLRIDQVFTVTTPQGGENEITVRDGKIAVTQATCPDHYCMHRGFCDRGTDIVCLPNKLVIHFLGEQDVDVMIG